MGYAVRLIPSARKALQKLPRDAQERILFALALLQSTPIPLHAKKLSGKKGYYRIRVGEYRIIYQVREEELLILVIKVGHQKEVLHRE